MVGVSTVEVKCGAVVSTPGDPRSALAVEPDGRALDASLNLATAAVLRVEGVQLGEQGSRPGAYPKVSASARPNAAKAARARARSLTPERRREIAAKAAAARWATNNKAPLAKSEQGHGVKQKKTRRKT